ncbi:MAG: hypothetical protein ACFCUG_05080 [Thiotrichales bacterium]
MDEDSFRAIYRDVNPCRCVFEKAINARRCDCRLKHRFMLAGREGVSCTNARALTVCADYLDAIRHGSRFSLGIKRIEGPLPHSLELRVQAGGLLALQAELFPDQATAVEVYDIYQVLDRAVIRFGAVAEFPYATLVRGVVAFEVPRRRPPR